MKNLVITFGLCLCIFQLQAQTIRLEGRPAQRPSGISGVDEQLESYSVIDLQTDHWFNLAASKTGSISLSLNLAEFRELQVELTPVALIDPNCTTIIRTPEGTRQEPNLPAIFNYRGKVVGQPNSLVALTLADHTLSGLIKLEDGNTWYIEPLYYFDRSAPQDRYVWYNSSDVLDDGPERGCLAKELRYLEPPAVEKTSPPSCETVEIECGLAGDYQMVQKFGTISNVIAHEVTILNLVQTNYDFEFAQPIRLQITSIFVSSCESCDPWPLTSNYDDLYIAFGDWVNAGGFGQAAIDWALLMTPRDIDDLIAGYTFPGGMCGYWKVSLVIDYTDILCKLQKHTAHELGHSFGAGHTADGIMKVGGFCTDYWNPFSISQINNAIPFKSCLSECTALPPMQPLIFRHIYTPEQTCVTFNNACVSAYQVSTDDPNLSVTSIGTTICLQSIQEGARTSRVFVSALDYCGNPGELGVVWYVDIDMPQIQGTSDRDAASMEPVTTGPVVRYNNDRIRIEDPSETPSNKLVRVFDLNGRLLLEKQGADAVLEISLENLPQGMYVARIKGLNQPETLRILHF